jgi:Uma2 family endonuclease
MTSPAVAKPEPTAPATGLDNGLPAPFSLDISSILARLPDDDALDDWFLRFTADNENLGYQFEIDRHGRLWAMASDSVFGWRWSLNLCHDLIIWSGDGPGGLVFPGSAMVRTSARGRRAADAGWIAPEQITPSLSSDWQYHGIPFAPRFVVEIRSHSQTLESQQTKMAEWIAYGVALGWLIDPFLRQVHIYRPDAAPVVLDDPETVSGDPELAGFVFNVRDRVFDLA